MTIQKLREICLFLHNKGIDDNKIAKVVVALVQDDRHETFGTSFKNFSLKIKDGVLMEA